jgi:hypothetical protein
LQTRRKIVTTKTKKRERKKGKESDTVSGGESTSGRERAGKESACERERANR